MSNDKDDNFNDAYQEALRRIEEAQVESASVLDLSGLGLTAVPPEIGKLSQLKTLILSFNQLTAVPLEIGKLTQLTTLHLNHNQLTAVPPEIGKLSQLTTLLLHENQLTAVPPEIWELSPLTSLDLSHNQLTAVPPEIGKLSQLTTLDLSGNQLTAVPPAIGKLSQLTRLDLSRNQLTAVPPAIGTLSQLTTLDLSSNQLTAVPPELGKLSQLTELNLFSNQLTAVPLEIWEMTQLTTLNLFSNQLTAVPPEIGKLSQLTELWLNDNQLTAVPPEIGTLSHLTSLYLSHNQLTAVPPEIGTLSHLTSLNLSGNQLTAVPPEIGKLSQLTVLYLLGNQLTAVPLEIWEMTQLTELSLDGNQLTAVPPEVLTLNELTKLVLNGNQITELPSAIVTLTGLKKYHVVTEGSDPFQWLFEDNIIQIDGNLRYPPEEILALGSDAIRNYLQNCYEGHEQVWASKCLLVGEGGVGKTCLYNALNGEPCAEYKEGTVGIEIGPLELAHPTQPDVTLRLNCWDFAGQDFNHAMHQFFFSDRALILLVWNARHGYQQGKLYRWLENIRVRAPRAKVILVATHSDQPHSDYPAAELQASYPQIVATIKVSNTSGDNIDQLRELIRQHAADLPLMGSRWPTAWLAAANAVRDFAASDHNLASRRDIYEKMRPHGLDDEECRILMGWLHELGDLLNFADVAAIADYVILTPEWLTKHIGVVLRSQEVADNKGILTRQHLSQLWHDLDSHIHDLFLHIMDKFDLAYRIPDDPTDRSLIVERLPLDPPTSYQAKWAEFEGQGNEIRLRLKLDSMQPGIPTWFIARCHRFTMGEHWLNGVLFRDEEHRHRALVIAHEQQKTVEMMVRGPFPQRFMSLLRDGFRDTLKRYKGLGVTRWVPCPGYDELEDRPCRREFRLDALESWLEKRPKRTHFHCDECDTELSRLELVEGIGAAALTQPLTEQHIAELLDEKLGEQTAALTEHFDARVEGLLQYHERNFLRAFELEQQRELITCPNLFTIRQVASSNLIKKQEWHIQLYCQQPGAWHPVGEPYVIEEQREWVQNALPYLKLLHKALSVAAPLAGAALAIADVASDKIIPLREQVTIFENEVKGMGALLKALPDPKELADETGLLPAGRRDFGKHEGANLVAIRELMDKLAAMDKAAGRPIWGGLTRRQTPEGDILWLDEEHLYEYLTERQRQMQQQ